MLIVVHSVIKRSFTLAATLIGESKSFELQSHKCSNSQRLKCSEMTVRTWMTERAFIAFEHFHLKSCIDFKPRQTEKCYLSVRKNPGCYSYVSRIIKSGQVVSIGEQCDHLGIVEHEFLHVLGLYHEQSRYDRDDYITIMWKNIKDGTVTSFKKSTPTSSTTFNAPYDYLSLMHYGKNFFSKNMENTIVTKLPQYQDKIGQRMEMSPTDIYKLNHLYNCSKFSLLLKSPLYIHYFKMFA
uniref:Metalloendopeptidase n=1 Tax=Amphiprion percula TaxID=161767 RepID=A0A3P8SCF0_AMPPE